jgi:hypothetical protein
MKTGLRHSQVRPILVALACVIGSAGFAFPETTPVGASDSQPTITVQVYNYSRASLAVVADAEREAGRILGTAGLKTVWLECPVAPVSGSTQGSCQKAPDSVDLRLRVLGSPVRNRLQDSVFGFAVHPVLASVYFDAASRRAHNDDAEFEATLILGCAIAHELGHLLLGTDSHSQTGIMQSRWESVQFRQLTIGTLVFTPEQSERIRADARVRTKIAGDGPAAAASTPSAASIPEN